MAETLPFYLSRSAPALIEKASKADIEELARKFEPKLAQAILAAFNAWSDKVSVAQLAAALQSGNVDAVLSALKVENIDQLFGQVRAQIAAAAAAGGAATVASMAAAPRFTALGFAFDTLNPALIQQLQNYTFGLVREINAKTMEAIRSSLVSGMTAGKNPRSTAIDIKRSIGLTQRQMAAVQNYRKELETFHLKRTAGGYNLGGKINRVNGAQVMISDEDGLPTDGILQRRLRDFRFDGTLRNAMTNKQPLAASKIEMMVQRYYEKYVKYRSQTIARTESLRSTNLGVQSAWEQAIADNVVQADVTRRIWSVARDERLCEWCAPIPGMNPKRGVKMDQPFNTPKGPQFLPPMHPNCRCTVFIRFWEPSQLEDEGK
jgi:hypothetical protein